MSEMEKEVIAIISKVLKIPEEKIYMNANLFSDLGADSLLGVELLAALDKKYNISIPEEKLGQIKMVSDLIKTVQEYKKA
jgi:acyl carrier protein